MKFAVPDHVDRLELSRAEAKRRWSEALLSEIQDLQTYSSCAETADHRAAILSWTLPFGPGRTREWAVGLPPLGPRCLEVAFTVVARVLARMHPDAECELSQIIDHELVPQLGSSAEDERRGWYHDALTLLRDLENAGDAAGSLSVLQVRFLDAHYNSLLPWMNLEALAAPDNDVRALLCMTVERFMNWRANSSSNEAESWRALRLAAHARLLRGGDADPGGRP